MEETNSIEQEKSKYTRKIEIPVYEPSNTMPKIDEIYNTSKRDELISEIEKENIPEELKTFLKAAAERHVQFDFSKIADYYSHLPYEFKRFFEKSGLVIVDYDNAIRNGFLAYQEELDKTRLEYVDELLSDELSKERQNKIRIKQLNEEKKFLAEQEKANDIEGW
jgi:hypothetical protein